MTTRQKYHPLAILAVILCIGAFLRFFQLGKIPVGLYVDETAIGVDAVSVAQTGKDMHGNSMWSALYPSYGDYKLPVYILLAAGSVKLFGATEFAVRFPSALAGVATIFLVYGLSIELFKKRKDKEMVALAAAAVTAILPWDVLFSRTGFEGHVGQAFLLFALLFALKTKERWWFIIFSAVFGAVAVYTYYSARFVFPVVFFGAFFLNLNMKVWKKQLALFVSGMFVFFCLLIPMVKSPLYAKSQAFRLSAKSILQDQDKHVQYANALRQEDGNSLFSRLVHHRDLYLLKDLAKNYSTFFDGTFLFLNGDPNLRHGTGETGLMLVSFFPLFLVGIYVVARRYRKLGLFLLTWWIVALLPAAVPLELPHALRSLNGLGVLPLVCGLGAVELYIWIKKKKFNSIIFTFFVVFFLLNIFFVVHDYIEHYPSRSASSWFDGNKQVALFVKDQKKNYDHVVISGDEKMFLWILFYGGYTGKQMQQLPSTRYWKIQVDNISFGPDAVRSISTLSGRVLVIGMNEELGMLKQTTSINGTLGSPVYAYGVWGTKK